MKIIVYYICTVKTDGEEQSTKHISTFLDQVEAEDIFGSMQCGVFDDDYVTYYPTKIEYVLNEEEA